jgi:hypothetical protein
MLGADDEIELDAVLPLVVERGWIADPVVRALSESGRRQGERIEQGSPLSAEEARRNDVAGKWQPGLRIADHAPREQRAEVAVSHRRGGDDAHLLFDKTIALPLLAPEEEQLLL